MESGTFRPGVSADDGDRAGTVNNSYQVFGHYTTSRKEFCRFANVTIPKGSNINSAKIISRALIGYSTTACNVNLYLNDSDDAIAPINATTYDALALTDPIAWNAMPTMLADHDYDSPDISSILQAIVDRGGWESGNAVMLLIMDNGSTSNNRRAQTSFNGSATNCLRLYVEWTEGDVPIEVDISDGAGVKAEMTALHLVDEIVPEAGIKAAFDGYAVSLFGGIAPESGIKAEFEPLHFVDPLPAGAGVKAAFGAAGSEYQKGVQAGAGIMAEFAYIPMSDTLPAAAGIRMALACGFEYLRSMAAEAGVAADFDGFNWSDFLRVYRDRISIRYKLTLSDGILDDIDIPISSFQGRFRTGDPTFLSVVVPGNDQYEDITDRDEGDLILTMQYLIDGVVYHSEEICTVDLEEIRLDEGASSVSVTISGHRTVTYIPKTTRLTGESYKAVYGGKIRYRCTPDLYLRPGDTCIVGDDTFTAGVITWMVNPSYVTMEVAEAEELA